MPSLRDIFFVFLKMGAFSFGGVYSMLGFFQRELVDKRGWLTQDEFAEGVALGQMTPGPPIVNTGIFIGYRLRGAKGGLAATAGQVFPGFALVIVFGYLYFEYRELPALAPVLKGIGAAVVGLLASVVYKMAVQMVRDFSSALVSVGAFVLLHFAGVNPIALIFLSGLAGYLVYGRRR